MKIILAKTAGFCMGVRRAVEMALDAPSEHQKPIYTYGPLIHNPQVLDLFADKGVTVLDRIPECGKGTVLVRAHGIPPNAKQALRKAGFTVIDATCPRVVKVQSIIKSHARKDYAVIIAGDQDHPEVIGLLGFAGDQGYVVRSLGELESLPAFDKAIIVAQTTQNLEFYRQVRTWAETHRPHYKVFDTICDSTEKRQEEVRQMARIVDAVIVVGGKNSGNTRRLAEVALAAGKPAYYIESEEELDVEALSRVRTIGITAGASTPGWIIKRILRAVETIPLTRWQGWRTYSLRVKRLLLLTNTYLALGAGCLCYATMQLMGLPVLKPALPAAVLYIMSMHILNHLTGRAEDKYNDPDREKFYRRYKRPLVAIALVAGTLGLVAAFKMGVVPFWALFTMSLMGLSYNLRLLPLRAGMPRKIIRIRDIPGSKTILISVAWGVVTVVLPALAVKQDLYPGALLAFLWACGIVFARTAFFDVLDMQGDRIVGKETIPVLIGPRKSFQLLKGLLVFVSLLLAVAGAAGVFSSLAWALIACPIFLLGLVIALEKGSLLPGIRMEFKVESLFLLSGIIAFGYALI